MWLFLTSFLILFTPIFIHPWLLHRKPTFKSARYEDYEPDGLEGIKYPNPVAPIYQEIRTGLFKKEKIIIGYQGRD